MRGKKIICLLSFVMILLASCVNKEEVAAPEYVPEGEPARISLTLSVPDMDPISRAAGIDPDAAAARTVNNLWLGFFNPSGDCIFKYSVPTLEATSDPHNTYGTIKLENVPALSGNCMIVAVANARTTNAVNVKSGKTGNLWTLLENIGTKEEFDQLSVIMPSSTEIARVSSSSFVMCGVYTEAGDTHGNRDVPTEVTIYPEVKQTLRGRIHLRRLDAYVKFEIRPNADITFTPVSWQVCNLPSASYVYEHMAATADNPFVNAGDHNWNNSDQAAKNTHYNNTLVYAASNFDPIFNNGQNVGYQFDFYQYENKRTGRISAENGFKVENGTSDAEYYGLREKEFKKEVDGSNTGWYRSLVAEPGTVTPAEPTYMASLVNNNATYVVIRAHVEYYHSNNVLVSPGTAGATLRTGDVIYTVHLGYCSGRGLDKANDYNCRRNAKYTYRISVNGVDDIRVEAIEEAPGEGENQSGAEGTITDLISTMFDVDSHYGVVNIQLSNNQRRNLVWRIQSPFEEKLIDMVGGNANQANVFGHSALINTADDADMQAVLPQNQFYNWIQIRPTTGENILADYPGDPRLIERTIRNDDTQVSGPTYLTDQIIMNDGEEKGGVWFLNDLADPDNYPHPDQTGNDDTPRWYTIFIDEYVYEYEYVEPEKSKSMTEYYDGELVDDGTGFKQSRTMDVERWRTYVNRDSRRVWIALSNMNVSKDGESIYSNSQYLITQESIQTYYGDSAPQGIGIESTNESYIGPDYSTVWNWVNYNNNVYDLIDGLLNQYNFVRSYRWDGSNSAGVRWDNILKHPNGYYPSNNYWNAPRLRTRGKRHILNTEEDVTYYIPDHPDYMMAACLSRNRDLNNDGIIGANEIRWYLPTVAVYSRIMLGAPSLRSPLFNVRDYPRNNNYLIAGRGTGYSHYYGSDHDQLWAEEFGATGSLDTGTATTIRCIRNIGQPTNLSPDDGKDGYETINAAYHRREVNGVEQNIIDLIFYDLAALRPATDGYIVGHELSDIMSYASSAFQFAREDCSRYNNTVEAQLNLQGLTFNGTSITGYDRTRWTNMLAVNGICGAYHEDGDGGAVWRVPNITELAIMYHLGLLSKVIYKSCSHEYLTTWSTASQAPRYMGTSSTTITAAVPGSNDAVRIRCVRDVPRADQ